MGPPHDGPTHQEFHDWLDGISQRLSEFHIEQTGANAEFRTKVDRLQIHLEAVRGEMNNLSRQAVAIETRQEDHTTKIKVLEAKVEESGSRWTLVRGGWGAIVALVALGTSLLALADKVLK